MADNAYQLKFSAAEIDALLQKINDMSPGSEGHSIWVTSSQNSTLFAENLTLIFGDSDATPKAGDMLIKPETLTVHQLRESSGEGWTEDGWTGGDALFSYETPLTDPSNPKFPFIQFECVGYGKLNFYETDWTLQKEDIDNLLSQDERKPYYKIKWDSSQLPDDYYSNSTVSLGYEEISHTMAVSGWSRYSYRVGEQSDYWVTYSQRSQTRGEVEIIFEGYGVDKPADESYYTNGFTLPGHAAPILGIYPISETIIKIPYISTRMPIKFPGYKLYCPIKIGVVNEMRLNVLKHYDSTPNDSAITKTCQEIENIIRNGSPDGNEPDGGPECEPRICGYISMEDTNLLLDNNRYGFSDNDNYLYWYKFFDAPYYIVIYCAGMLKFNRNFAYNFGSISTPGGFEGISAGTVKRYDVDGSGSTTSCNNHCYVSKQPFLIEDFAVYSHDGVSSKNEIPYDHEREGLYDELKPVGDFPVTQAEHIAADNTTLDKVLSPIKVTSKDEMTDKTQHYINSDGYLYKYGTITQTKPFNKDCGNSSFSFTLTDIDTSQYTHITIDSPEAINWDEGFTVYFEGTLVACYGSNDLNFDDLWGEVTSQSGEPLPDTINITIQGWYSEDEATDDLMFYVAGEFEGFYQTDIRYCPDDYDELSDTVEEILNKTGGSNILLATIPSSDSSLIYTQYILLPEGKTLNVGDLILHTDGIVKQITQIGESSVVVDNTTAIDLSGKQGESGVYVGEEEPSEDVDVWVDPSGEGIDLDDYATKTYVDELFANIKRAEEGAY